MSTYSDAIIRTLDVYHINSPTRSAFKCDIVGSAFFKLQGNNLRYDVEKIGLEAEFERLVVSGEIMEVPFDPTASIKLSKYYKATLTNKCPPPVAIVCDPNAPAVNDHVCPTCKNTRCSKTEKTCWRCGNNLHAA